MFHQSCYRAWPQDHSSSTSAPETHHTLARPATSSSPANAFSASPDAHRSSYTIRSVTGSGYRRRRGQDEFDGACQFLDVPELRLEVIRDEDVPVQPSNLDKREQDGILCRAAECLSHCAFNFVAKYRFPIPIEQGKRPVTQPSDRGWDEWVHLLQRLALRRRIPAYLLYDSQVKQLHTTLESSLEMHHAAKHLSRPLKDDRHILQLISAGIQVAKILRDASAMRFLIWMYMETERLIGTNTGRHAIHAFPTNFTSAKNCARGHKDLEQLT